MRPLAALFGLGALTAGCWAAWAPLAGIVPGALLLGLAVFGEINSRRRLQK